MLNKNLNLHEILQTLFYITTAAFIIIWFYLNIVAKDLPDIKQFLEYYTQSYGVIAFMGAILGFFAFSKWGDLKSLMGRALFLFTLGLFFQFLGQLSYTIYRMATGAEVSYPSFGEIFYFGSIPIYIYATWLLCLALDGKKQLKMPRNIISGVVVALAMVSLGYYLFLKDYDTEGVSTIAILLDYAYPITQALEVSLAIFVFFLSLRVLGGQLKACIVLVVIALYLQYVADTTYTYRIYADTYYGGDYTDLIYVLAYFAMGLSFMKFNSVYSKIINGGKKYE